MMEKLKIIVVDGVVETVFSTNKDIDVEVTYVSWSEYQKTVNESNATMQSVY